MAKLIFSITLYSAFKLLNRFKIYVQVQVDGKYEDNLSSTYSNLHRAKRGLIFDSFRWLTKNVRV